MQEKDYVLYIYEGGETIKHPAQVPSRVSDKISDFVSGEQYKMRDIPNFPYFHSPHLIAGKALTKLHIETTTAINFIGI